MKRYWILWTYIANYNSIPLTVTADSPMRAAEVVFEGFSEEFREKATLHIFDRPPAMTIRKGVTNG
jgi:hypothetical protein